LDNRYALIAKKLLLQNTKKIILVEGIQSGGSTLLSTCFLQHRQINGIRDLLHTWDFNIWLKANPNLLLRMMFSPLKEPIFVLKFTCGHQVAPHLIVITYTIERQAPSSHSRGVRAALGASSAAEVPGIIAAL